MKPFVKIGLFTAIFIISFVVYLIVIGIAYGIQPTQAISAFMPTAEGEIDSIIAVVDSVNTDSLETTDSTLSTATSSVSDSISNQLALLNKKVIQLESLRVELSRLKASKAITEDERLYSLAKMYEGVEASQLAQVFAKMDDSLVIAILPKMKAQKAGKILESLPPERAAKISSMMLGKG